MHNPDQEATARKGWTLRIEQGAGVGISPRHRIDKHCRLPRTNALEARCWGPIRSLARRRPVARFCGAGRRLLRVSRSNSGRYFLWVARPQLNGWPKTSGSRGMHVNVRIKPRWTFTQVRRAAVALSRAVERRAPTLASSKWWKEERHGVFLDYNQNAKDRTTCSAYSVRPVPDARVSTPLDWHEVPDCNPADFTIFTVPERFAKIGNPHAEMDASSGSLDKLLELADKDEAAGIADAPWPPHFRKMEGEAARVMPSRAKSAANKTAIKKPRVKMPLITVANSPDKAAALAGLERWKAKHADIASLLAVDDVLVDSMRGRSSTWTRIRINLRHVPEERRTPQEKPDPDDDPTREWRERWKKKKANE